MQDTLDLGYSQSTISFTWFGFDEMDEVSGDGHAELLDDGSVEIAFAYHNGDEAIPKETRDFFNSLLGDVALLSRDRHLFRSATHQLGY
ncbi:hypothetical protein [Phyllobacterium salinisoli]|uniref:hypothetical protein n=1 Tax=Phyllobacterium salinisoli TaxID=1899321 RepID=UPI001FE0F9D3|nr:hypothetical protein [Phyllobacterium salinisoli]